MNLKDLLSILKQDVRVTIKTDNMVKPFQIEWAYVEDVARDLPKWLSAFVSGLTMDNDGDYVITIVPDDKEG